MTRAKATLVAVAAAVLAVLPATAGCADQTVGKEKPDIFVPNLPTPPQRPPAYVGDTLELDRIGDSRIAVTLVQVHNPATVRFGRDPAMNYLATALRIKNLGRLTITGDANNDVSVVGSDQQSYPASLATTSDCSNFVYGQFVLAPQESATGCVTFALPTGVSPATVRYSPSSGISLDVGEWTLP